MTVVVLDHYVLLNDVVMCSSEFRSHLEYRPIASSDPIENHQICVCVRKRPMNKKGRQYVGWLVYFE